jgi:hypothetical protein
MADFDYVVLAGKNTRYSAKPRDTSELTQGLYYRERGRGF